MRGIDLIRRRLVFITSEEPYMRAIEAMASENVGAVVVVDNAENRKLLGIITERDVIRALANKLPLDTPVSRVGTMGPRVVKARANDSVANIASLMVNHRVRHVVIVDEEDRVLGVVSIRDILGDIEALREIVRSGKYPKSRE